MKPKLTLETLKQAARDFTAHGSASYSLDLMALARLLGKERAAARLLAKRQISGYAENARQRFLFGEEITQ